MRSRFHEYSHNYCDTNDYYYIGYINGRLRGTRAGDLDRFLKNSPWLERVMSVMSVMTPAAHIPHHTGENNERNAL